MKEEDIKYYEEMSELFTLKGWEHLQKMIEIDLNNLDAAIWEVKDDREIAVMQGHKAPLVYFRDLQKNLKLQFDELRAQAQEIAEEEDDADL